jgi:uncharacterized membrane protein YbhN (UPF0104 family)
MEKLIEGLSMGLIAVPMALLSHPSPALRYGVALFGIVVIAALGLALLVAWRGDVRALEITGKVPRVEPEGEPEPTPSSESSGEPLGNRFEAIRRVASRFVARLAGAMRLLNAPRTWLITLWWSCVADLADVAILASCLYAVGIHLEPAIWFVIFVAINLAIAVPSTPGNLGVFEAGAVLTLGTLGVGPSEAFTFAILYHAAHVIPVTVVGAFGLTSEVRQAAAPDNTSN